MMVSLVVAMTDDCVIGRQGELPWHLRADLQRFRQRTMGHAILMGRKTYESIGRPLPGRTSIVITRQPDYESPGVLVADSIASALQFAADQSEVFIIGGGEIYAQTLPLATRLYITRVHGHVSGDRFFPEWDPSDWRLVEQDRHEADENNDFACTFERYDRIGQPSQCCVRTPTGG